MTGQLQKIGGSEGNDLDLVSIVDILMLTLDFYDETIGFDGYVCLKHFLVIYFTQMLTKTMNVNFKTAALKWIMTHSLYVGTHSHMGFEPMILKSYYIKHALHFCTFE
jgi:hypothetical protein